MLRVLSQGEIPRIPRVCECARARSCNMLCALSQGQDNGVGLQASLHRCLHRCSLRNRCSDSFLFPPLSHPPSWSLSSPHTPSPSALNYDHVLVMIHMSTYMYKEHSLGVHQSRNAQGNEEGLDIFAHGLQIMLRDRDLSSLLLPAAITLR